MSADLASTFTDSLEERGVTWTRTTPAGFEETLRETIETPAVGAPLPFEEVSLDGLPVEIRPTADQLREAVTGVTAAGAGIAAHGTLVIQSRPGGDEAVSLYPERHVAVVRESDVLEDVTAALDWLAGEFAAGRDTAVFETGASATADMGELIEGVHGPGEVYAIVLESEDAEAPES